MSEARSVSEVTFALKALVEEAFPSIRVRGEISNWRPAASGHVYFSLRDPGATLTAVLWRSQAGRVRFPVRDGMQVVATGRIDVYAPHGKYQMVVSRIEPEGEGAAALALERLKERLRAEGLFDPARKRPLPLLPRHIGIVTSPTGQAVRDLLRNVLRRFPRARVTLRPVRVQGETAAAEIAAALRDLDDAGGVDVVVVGRGGGSAEDLGAFNDEAVARAIAASRAPVVSAVGHEGDFTVADLVADLRVSTPTAAAEAVVPVLRDLEEDLRRHRGRLDDGLRARLSLARERVLSLEGRHALRRPVDRVHDLSQRVDELRRRLDDAAARRAADGRAALAAAAARVEGVSPLSVLARGFSVTSAEGSATPLRDAASVASGDRITTRLARGRVRSRVEVVEPA